MQKKKIKPKKQNKKMCFLPEYPARWVGGVDWGGGVKTAAPVINTLYIRDGFKNF